MNSRNIWAVFLGITLFLQNSLVFPQDFQNTCFFQISEESLRDKVIRKTKPPQIIEIGGVRIVSGTFSSRTRLGLFENKFEITNAADDSHKNAVTHTFSSQIKDTTEDFSPTTLGETQAGVESVRISISQNNDTRQIERISDSDLSTHLDKAKKGNLASMKIVGTFFLRKEDDHHNEAYKWLEMAADKGDGYSLDAIGDSYFSGTYRPRDVKKAFSFYKKAAEAGLTSSAGMIGKMYATGMGTEKNLILGYIWCTAAIENGSTSTKYGYDSIVYEMTPMDLKSARNSASSILPKHFYSEELAASN